MAQPATNPKIEELRFKLKTDPKSRLFYPLAEELRKAGQSGEAEQVLRTGLEHHVTYLSAWVSLGRALREQKKDAEAVDALSKALQLDPGNVVAARLLGDAYLALGEKVEAIKKYKLVHALMPADEELEGVIARLDAELNPPPAPQPVAAPVEVAPAPAPEPEPEPVPEPAPEPQAESESPFAETAPQLEPVESLFATSEPAFSDNPFGAPEQQEEVETGDVEPMRVAHEESPFEEPVAEYTSAAASIEAPSGFSIDSAPATAEVAAPVVESEESDVFAPAAAPEPFAFEPPPPEPPADDIANTITMADLYARQGLTDDARQIYENILARHPENDVVREKLAALEPEPSAPEAPEPEFAAPPSAARAKIDRLQAWLAKIKGTEVGRV